MPLRILVVDDNLDTLRVYVKNLLRKIKTKNWDQALLNTTNKSSIEVEEADTVSLALKKLGTQMFEILVVDLKIPGLTGEAMGGLDLISESLKLNPLRPIIAITGFGSIELARITLKQGVFDFIEKSQTAVDDLVDAVQRAIDSSNEKIMRSGNPFTRMTGEEPTVFGGRIKELEFFEQRLNRALHTRFREHFLVLGNWGIGKSTLLKEYKKICQSRNHVASIVYLESLQSGTKLIEAARSIVEGILRDLPYPIDRFKKVAKYFDSLGITVLGTGFQFSRNTSETGLSPQAFLHDTLLNLWQDLEDKTEAFVILLDDLDNFMAVSEIVMTLKQTLSMDSIKKTKILVGITSTPANWLKLTSIDKHHPLARYFISRIELAPLSEKELRETIFNSLSRTGISFNTAIVEQVFEYTKGHPFEMQVLCYHLFNNQFSKRVEVEVWDKSLQSTLDDIGIAIFDHWFRQASVEESKVLRVVASEESPISTKKIHEISKTYKLGISSQNIAKYLQRLVGKKLIAKSGRGLYLVPDKMFRSYVLTRSF